MEADFTWTGREFAPGVQIGIDGDGAITEVGALRRPSTNRLSGQAILPGFVNAHSHAFQRGLRGKGERFFKGSGDFWSWRQAMYDLVEDLDADRFYQVCLSAYNEMRDRGITTVGEFHYLHHSRNGADYALDDLVLQAAADSGIRIALLETYYRTGGFGHRAGRGQQRFLSPSLEAYWEQVERIEAKLDGRTQTIGVVAHSLRAVTLDDVAALVAEAQRRKMVLHVHLEEQQREVDDCLTFYGKRPLALMNELGNLDGLTAIHCTHATPSDIQQFVDAGGTVCVCPVTEANLGDGIPSLALVPRCHEYLCLGTDSNARISMVEEMRWLEYGQRLATQSRGILIDADGMLSTSLLRAATENGARALGVRTGRIAPGCAADFVTINLDAPSLRGCEGDALLDALIFGGGDEAVTATCVAGQWRTSWTSADR